MIIIEEWSVFLNNIVKYDVILIYDGRQPNFLKVWLMIIKCKFNSEIVYTEIINLFFIYLPLPVSLRASTTTNYVGKAI